jgi:ABC-type multidrug transport system ATPase subunit
LILALAEETETSFFICTHQTSFAEDVCDVIGILNQGELVTLGSPNEVIDSLGSKDLEDAYLKVVGGHIDRKALLAWR